MAIIGWAVGVNRKIIDSTSITVGEKGYVEDSGDSGAFKERRLTSLCVPDTFSVTMDFDWLTKDSNGKSELDRFVDWYKYRHKRGVNPFEFPSITNFNIYHSTEDNSGAISTCYYKITSGLSMQKSGYSMRVTMTWEEYYSGVINIADEVLSVSELSIKSGTNKCFVKVYFNKAFDTMPTNVNEAYPLYLANFSSVASQGIPARYFKETVTCTGAYGNYLSFTFDKKGRKGLYKVALTSNLTGSDNSKLGLKDTVSGNATNGYIFNDLNAPIETSVTM